MINFAHAGEVHETIQDSSRHLLSSPYMNVPLFILFIIGLYFLLAKLKVKLPNILNIQLAILLIVGVVGYTYTPILSIVSISGGITLALFLVLSGLAKG